MTFTVKLIISLVISAVISYLMGGLNSAIISVKLLEGEDIRKHGSGNAGLTNTLRCFGKVPAICTLVGDLLKGVIAVLISKYVVLALILPELEFTAFIGYFSGIFCILGHIFPIYYGFKGGKGVLVSSSILLVVDPVCFCIIIPFFILMVILTKYVSVSSMTAAAVYPFLTFALQYFAYNWEFNHALTDALLVVVTSIILIYMHKENIQRLKNGTENKFSVKSKKK
ncbi:MAG: glycerol-3-phosphate 1-O-acyltransferase PlsY [Oscillospiraceae bacterium]|nr:glycerol-3-phosphate 1-O-acyltransferase PlsY [Oscillospiraceae bacterium]